MLEREEEKTSQYQSYDTTGNKSKRLRRKGPEIEQKNLLKKKSPNTIVKEVDTQKLQSINFTRTTK